MKIYQFQIMKYLLIYGSHALSSNSTWKYLCFPENSPFMFLWESCPDVLTKNILGKPDFSSVWTTISQVLVYWSILYDH